MLILLLNGYNGLLGLDTAAKNKVHLHWGVIDVDKKKWEAKLLELKSDYIRIQQDMDKLEFVGGRVQSAEEQLVRLEKEIADVNKELAKYTG